MISRITMKNCPPYIDGEGLENCKKVNYIYGTNGSGKSTISECLRKIEDYSDRFADSEIEWEDHSRPKVLVYNKEFKKLNFEQDDTFPGVFTFGQATIEEIKAINDLRSELDFLGTKEKNLYKNLKEKEEELDRLKQEFIKGSWIQIFKRYDEKFKEAFTGFRNNQKNFADHLLTRYHENKGVLTPIDDLIRRSNSLYKDAPIIYDLINWEIDNDTKSIKSILADTIWDTVISGNKDIDIAKLIDDLDISSWVLQGKKYIKDNSDICPFCQSRTITDSFKNKLEKYFDKEFEEKQNHLSELKTSFLNLSTSVINKLDEILVSDSFINFAGKDVDLYTEKVKSIKDEFYKISNLIDKKINEPGRRICLEAELGIIDEWKNKVNDINKLIISNNDLVGKISSEKDKLKDDIWKYCINENKLFIDKFIKQEDTLNKAISGLNSSIDQNTIKIKEVKDELRVKSKNVTSIKSTIDEINKSLESYGFNNFRISESKEQKDKYIIIRDDGSSACNTLSEGEETFLAFLYFIQLTKGSTDPNRVYNEKIIVIDDPISSLDSNILYVVSTMVKNLINKVLNGKDDLKQIFVLTHNVYFYKEISHIYRNPDDIKKNVRHSIIRKNDGMSVITDYGFESPISTSYELLWKDLKDNKSISKISLQNTMRRIIEYYFNMLGKKRKEYILNHFEDKDERAICNSLLAWMDDGSHSMPDDIYIDSYTDAVPRYKKVFKDIFYKTDNAAHYNMMMEIEN